MSVRRPRRARVCRASRRTSRRAAARARLEPVSRVVRSALSRAMMRAMRREMAKRASACVRNYAAGTAKSKTANAAETNDVVKRVFVEQQTKFRALLAKTKDLKPPVGGDATAVKAYATKKLAILKEVRRSRCVRDACDAPRRWERAIASIGAVDHTARSTWGLVAVDAL
jgi:hypothetical protein